MNDEHILPQHCREPLHKMFLDFFLLRAHLAFTMTVSALSKPPARETSRAWPIPCKPEPLVVKRHHVGRVSGVRARNQEDGFRMSKLLLFAQLLLFAPSEKAFDKPSQGCARNNGVPFYGLSQETFLLETFC